jgi:hypothetical protein
MKVAEICMKYSRVNLELLPLVFITTPVDILNQFRVQVAVVSGVKQPLLCYFGSGALKIYDL